MQTTKLHPEVIDQIKTANIPDVVNDHVRKLDRKVQAEMIRDLLKSLGIKHISVTVPTYSMATVVEVKTPYFFAWSGAHEDRHDEIRESGEFSERAHCEYCVSSATAKGKLYSIILAAFPDLDNRSDSTCDHFDNCISVS